MSSIKGGVGDISGLLKKLTGADEALEKSTKIALKKSVLLVHATAIKSIRSRTSGTIGTRYKPKRTVVVSKPGDTPNFDQGGLVKSIMFEFEGNSGFIGSNLKYAAWLEFGTEHMEPRPWLAPALEKASDQIAKFMQDAINDGFQKAFGIKGLVRGFDKLSKSGSKSVSSGLGTLKKVNRSARRKIKRMRR